MVHRALLGSIERFFGVLIEHYGGAFPVWLAPIQVVTIPVAPAFNDYAQSVANKLTERGFRVDADLSDGRMGAKIRYHQSQKVPYMLIVGEKEEEAGAVSIRPRTGDQVNGVPFDEFADMMQQKVESKATEL
jgi:threonyl-tRNA synthetase